MKEKRHAAGSDRGAAGLLSLFLAASAFLLILSVPVSGATGSSAIRGGNALHPLAATHSNSSTTVTATQNSSLPGPNMGFSCGFHSAQSSAVVASSPAGAGARVTVGEPSWLQLCTSYGNVGESFPAYEIFPVTVYATPGTSFTLSIGRASHTPEQIAEGMGNNTIWTGFDPVNVTTDAEGIAQSNFTLAGAVMPFVPNDIANVSLPIIALSPSGVQAAAGLPIEFSGSEVGGIDIIHVLGAPGPIMFSGVMEGSSGNPTQYAYGIVYAPPASESSANPIPVTLAVAGSWNNGAVGAMPGGVQVTITQPSFTLYPNQVFYFFVDENSIAETTAQAASNYTIAIQESVGGSSFLEPLSVSVSNLGITGSFGAFPAGPNTQVGGSAGNGLLSVLSLAAAAAAVVVVFSIVYLRQRRSGVNPGTASQRV
jgi:hypothetical protein